MIASVYSHVQFLSEVVGCRPPLTLVLLMGAPHLHFSFELRRFIQVIA